MCGPDSRAQDARGLGGDGVHSGGGRNPVFALAFSASTKTDSRPCVFRPASLRAGFFLLLVQEKETKEKDSPASPPSAHPARKVRERRPRFADSAPALTANARTSCARPCGLFRPSSTAAEGARKSKSGALLRAEAEALVNGLISVHQYLITDRITLPSCMRSNASLIFSSGITAETNSSILSSPSM